MKKKLELSVVVLLILTFFSALTSFANDESPDPLLETQKLLKDPSFREKNAKESKEANQIDQRVKSISGDSANEQAIYELAAEVMGNMKNLSPEEMTKIVEQAMKDPAAYAASWTPEQKKKLKNVSERLPSSKAKLP